jgi:ankyrin repeat protein
MQPYILEVFPQPHVTPALICIQHLALCGFHDKRADFDDDDPYKACNHLSDSLNDDPLLDYAYRSWVHHAHFCAHDECAAAAVADFVHACRGYPADIYHFRELDFLGPLQVAAFYGFDKLIHSAAQIQHQNARTPVFEESALPLACLGGEHACAAYLLSIPGTNVNLRAAFGDTALLVACRKGDIETVKLLLAVSDIDVSIADDGGCTALHVACSLGHIDIVKLLLNVRDIDVNTPVCTELSNPLTGAVNLASTEHGAKPSGFFVNAVDDDGKTALMDASLQGYTAIVKSLLAVPGIHVFHADEYDETALALAFEGGHEAIVDLILDFWIQCCTAERRSSPD